MKEESKGFFERRQTIVAALIAVAGSILVAWMGLRNRESVKPPQEPPPTQAQLTTPRTARLTGRVLNAQTRMAISSAKVSLELAGVTPLLRYPDGEGVFDFGLPANAEGVRIRVEAKGYQPYDRWVNVSSSSGIEEIRLEPNPVQHVPSPVTVTQRPDPGIPAYPAPVPPAPVKKDSIIDETLRPVSGGDGPWAVVIYGGRQDRRGDVVSWVRSALAGSGHDTVNLFRRTSDEQRVAAELYRGSSELYTRMQAGRFVSRILVGQLTVTNHPGLEGLLIAEAKLAVHVLSPSGELLKSFVVSEKGGALDVDSAQRNAINELEAVIQRELPAAL